MSNLGWKGDVMGNPKKTYWGKMAEARSQFGRQTNWMLISEALLSVHT